MIRLGYVKEDNEIYEIDPICLKRHSCIFGMTGSGKSTTMAILAYELSLNHIPSLIIDRTGEFKQKLGILKKCNLYIPGSNLSLSPFELWNGEEIDERINKQIWLLDEFCRITWNEGLSPLQSRILHQALYRIFKSLKETSFKELIEEARNVAKEELKLWFEAAEAIASRFGIFSTGRFNKVFKNSKGRALDEFFNEGIHIVDLSIFEHEAPKNLFSLIILSLLMIKIKQAGFSNEIRLALMIDEAHNIASKDIKYGSVEKIAMELRKYGLSLILASSSPSQISSNILANTGLLIMHQMLSSYEIEALKKHAYIGEYGQVLEEILGSLKIGEAFIRSFEDKEGRIVKIGIKEHEKIIC